MSFGFGWVSSCCEYSVILRHAVPYYPSNPILTTRLTRVTSRRTSSVRHVTWVSACLGWIHEHVCYKRTENICNKHRNKHSYTHIIFFKWHSGFHTEVADESAKKVIKVSPPGLLWSPQHVPKSACSKDGCSTVAASCMTRPRVTCITPSSLSGMPTGLCDDMGILPLYGGQRSRQQMCCQTIHSGGPDNLSLPQLIPRIS